MNYFRNMSRGVSLFVVVAFLGLGIPTSAYAGVLGTDASVNSAQLSKAHEFLARQDVQEQLVNLGVDQADAVARVNSMSQEELVALNGKLEKLPAGGDALSVVLLVFLVLLLTDILGYTDIFPFVKSDKKK